MKQQRKKRFPFFSIPLPKFLREDLKKMDDFVVMLRLTPEITRLNYVGGVLYLIAFLIYLFLIVVVLLLIVLNVSFSALLGFVLREGGIFVAWSFLGVPIPSAHQNDALYFWLLLLVLAGAVWIAFQVRRAGREFRGLRQLHRMTAQQRAAFALQQFFRISLPLWLSPSITYEPTAEQLLALLREREQAIEGQTREIASMLADEDAREEEPEEQPSMRMLLTLTDHLSLSLLGPSGKQLSVDLTDAVAPLLGFLATQPKEAWTTKEVLFKQIYKPGQDSTFGMHRQRANDQIITRAREAGFFPQKAMERNPQMAPATESPSHPTTDKQDEDRSIGDEDTKPAPSTSKEIDLFELKMEGHISSWRLTPRCSIEVFPFLSTFYPKVIRAQALPEDPSLLSLEELRQGCHRLMSEYGIGFLAEHMKKGNYVWSWALPVYRQFREQGLAILSSAIVRESDYLGTLKEPKERHTVIESIAQLHGWRAIVATGLDLRDKGLFSEEDMEHCLAYYGQMRKRSDALAIYQRYSELRSQIEPSYKPGEVLQQLVEQVLHPQKNVSQSRKPGRED